jgi:hypothetical protein
MRAVACLGILFTAVGFVGCGSDNLSKVTGKVTLDGQPAADLQVKFEPVSEGGPEAIGKTQADGTYELFSPGTKAGAAPGEYLVRITPPETGNPDTQTTLPPKYNDQTELKATVAPGTNKFDFEVTKQ